MGLANDTIDEARVYCYMSAEDEFCLFPGGVGYQRAVLASVKNAPDAALLLASSTGVPITCIVSVDGWISVSSWCFEPAGTSTIRAARADLVSYERNNKQFEWASRDESRTLVLRRSRSCLDSLHRRGGGQTPYDSGSSSRTSVDLDASFLLLMSPGID